MASPGASGSGAVGGGAPAAPSEAFPPYKRDPDFFTRFTNLRLLRAPPHEDEGHPTLRVSFSYSGGANPAPPAPAVAPLLPEENRGNACAGAFGVVYSALDTVTGKKVAIKFSKQNFRGNRWVDPYSACCPPPPPPAHTLHPPLARQTQHPVPHAPFSPPHPPPHPPPKRG